MRGKFFLDRDLREREVKEYRLVLSRGGEKGGGILMEEVCVHCAFDLNGRISKVKRVKAR